MSLAVLLMALAAQENQGYVTPALCSLTYILVLTCTCENEDGIAKTVIGKTSWFGPASMPFKRKIMNLASTYAPQCCAICSLMSMSKKYFPTTNRNVLSTDCL